MSRIIPHLKATSYPHPPQPIHSFTQINNPTTIITTMDEDLIAFICFLTLFILFPISLALSITGCIAHSRTRAWQKERAQKAAHLEASDPLLDGKTNNLSTEDVEEQDFWDEEDEEEDRKRKVEELEEATMTFGQKWRKEFRKIWNGSGRNLIKEREREERKKLAKLVVRAMEKREARRAGEALPVYQ